MRRVWVTLALVVMALPAVGQVGGSWSSSFCILPTPSLGLNELVLNLDWNGWTFTSTSQFSGTWGWIWQEFVADGQFGAFGVEGTLLFGPVIPDFLYAQVIYSLEFGGIEFHVYTAMLGAALGGPVGGSVLEFILPAGEMTFTGELGFGATLPPGGYTIWHVSGSYKTYPTSPLPGGSAFTYALIGAEGLPLCCGITLDVTYSFTKAGFDSLTFSGINIPICCGISFDVAITYGVRTKEVSVTPKFAGIGEGCFAVWGRPQMAGASTWTGIHIDGFQIRCTIADCNYLEYVHAFNPWADSIPPEVAAKFLVDCGEYEYVELGFCGAGCCGGKYDVTLRILWGSVNPGLFGLTRFVGSVKVPVMANFTLDLDFVMPVYSGGQAGPCAPPSLCLGWTFTF